MSHCYVCDKKGKFKTCDECDLNVCPSCLNKCKKTYCSDCRRCCIECARCGDTHPKMYMRLCEYCDDRVCNDCMFDGHCKAHDE